MSCKKVNEMKDEKLVKNARGVLMYKGSCTKCGGKMSKFPKKSEK